MYVLCKEAVRYVGSQDALTSENPLCIDTTYSVKGAKLGVMASDWLFDTWLNYFGRSIDLKLIVGSTSNLNLVKLDPSSGSNGSTGSTTY